MRSTSTLLLLPFLMPCTSADDRPKPIPESIVKVWEADEGAKYGRSAALRLSGIQANDPFDEKAAEKPGELPTFTVTYKDTPGDRRSRRLADLSTVPAPEVPFGLFVYGWGAHGRLKQVARFTTIESLNCSTAHVSDLDIAELGALKNLRTLDLSLTQITWGIPSSLTVFPKLVELNLCGTLLHDKTADLIVEKLPRLQALNINSTPITDAGIRTLSQHRDLKHLHVRGTKITGAGLKELVAMNLRTLDLGSTQVTNADLKVVAGMKDLEALQLYSTKISDAGVGELSVLDRLRHLNLHVDGGIGEAGLKAVAGMKCLESLILRLDDSVTEPAMLGLATLPKLRQLHIKKLTFSAAEAARIQKAMPECKFTWLSGK